MFLLKEAFLGSNYFRQLSSRFQPSLFRKGRSEGDIASDIQYLEVMDYPDPFQSGFRPGHGSDIALGTCCNLE